MASPRAFRHGSRSDPVTRDAPVQPDETWQEWLSRQNNPKPRPRHHEKARQLFEQLTGRVTSKGNES